ncbi:MAG: hypothetical protein IJZ89_09145 [Clostridia bacterium]|nr:hypothetical protein [Clostridia bacterium]
MEKRYFGRLMVRVTVNGCGLPLEGARIYIDDETFTVPNGTDGFSQIISLFESDKKGIGRKYDLRAEFEGFEPLICENIPVTSGYLTVWNMPLSSKSKKVKNI